MAFKLGKETRGIKTSENTPHIYRDKLDDGILGEAYDDGTIAISVELEPGSKKEKEVIVHEMDHAERIQDGELNYGMNYVRWRGAFYRREGGEILYNNEWYEEGDPALPWEALAFEKSDKIKNS